MNKQTIAMAGAIIVSVLVMGLDIAVSWWLLVHPIADNMHDIVIFVAGNVNAMALAVVGFWVGSSSGSMIKTQTISGLTEVKTGPRHDNGGDNPDAN